MMIRYTNMRVAPHTSMRVVPLKVNYTPWFFSTHKLVLYRSVAIGSGRHNLVSNRTICDITCSFWLVMPW